MEKSNKRGKIPQADWPLIMARYEAGETLASIARTYDCSPPAISYVVSKSRARQPAPYSLAGGPSGPEMQLVKGSAGEPIETGSMRRIRPGPAAAHAGGERRAEAMSTGSDTAAPPASRPPDPARHPRLSHEAEGSLRDGFAARGPQPPHAQPSTGAVNGRPAPAEAGQRPAAALPPMRGETDTRHRLHLSLGSGTGSHNGSTDPEFPVFDPSPPSAAPSRSEAVGFSEAAPAPPPLRPHGGEAPSDAAVRKGGASAFIDHELRARVDTDIVAFLAAFDAALVEDTQENRSALREATDRLLRAGARTRIELERLEARIPLQAHDRSGGDPGTWRHR